MSDPLPTGAPSPGELIAGKYRIRRVLGIGGMGVVFAAQHEMLGEEVALKLMLADAMQGEDAVVRFVNEARSAAKVKGEHVVRVLDVAVLDDGRPYIVMELLEGVDLGQLLETSGPLAPETTVDYLLQAMEAIAQAHAKGLVHRDLKPSNLFLATQPDGARVIKVLDFGIAKASKVGPHALALTKTKALMGSPVYMAPELIRNSKDAGQQSDVWALGVTAFELLAGRTPFEGETVGELLLAIVEQAPPEVHALRRGIAPELGAVVACCLEKDRSRRYKTVVELARALRAFASPAGASSVDRVAAAFDRAGASSASGPDVARQAAVSSELAPTRVHPVAADPGSERLVPAVAGRTNAAWTGSRPAPTSARPRWLIPLVAGVGVTGAGVLFIALWGTPPSSPPAALRPIVSAPASPVPEPVTADGAPLPITEPATATTPASSASDPAPSPSASARAPRPRTPTPSPSPKPAPPSGLKKDRNSF
jgi:eukaryotic-like serine/threonine-protein kinase